jgi:NifU-like protein
VSFYPHKIDVKFRSPKHAGKIESANAMGTEASFICGSFVRFYPDIDRETKEIQAVQFQTNGCGYMIAAAETLADKIAGKRLTDLHGLDDGRMKQVIDRQLGEFTEVRKHCRDICIDAIHAAFSNYRASILDEFRGERAVICTCFGVSEDTIDSIIKERSAETIEEIAEICNAGTGCGSCRMMIQEMIDVHSREAVRQ